MPIAPGVRALPLMHDERSAALLSVPEWTSPSIRDACQVSPNTNTRTQPETLAVSYSLEYQTGAYAVRANRIPSSDDFPRGFRAGRSTARLAVAISL